MFELTRPLPLRRLLAEQGPALALSLLVAEFLYRFHSFTLETLAFLATWFVVDWALGTLRQLTRGTGSPETGVGLAHTRRS